MNARERFEAKYVKSPSGCWAWIASLSRGYGAFWDGLYSIRAHRFSYKLYVGYIPEGEDIVALLVIRLLFSNSVDLET